MRILVTGGSGFVGRPTVEALCARGHEVLAPGRSDLDLADSVAVRGFLGNAAPEGLVHLAWTTTPGDYWTSPENLDWVAWSLHLARVFRESGGKRVFVAGSSAEYDWSLAKDHVEDEPLRPQGLYGTAKDALRRILESWSAEEGVTVQWGRIFCPFGSGEKGDRLLPRIIRELATGGEAVLKGGEEVRDFLHVDDLGAAIAAVFDSEICGSVNLCSGEPVRIREIVEEVAGILGGTVRFEDDGGPGMAPRVAGDGRKLREGVGWEPASGCKTRLRETCQWWKGNCL